MSVASWCYMCFCVVLCVGFCTGHFVMVLLKQLSSKIYLKIISYNFFKISLQKYIIVVRNKKKLNIFTFLLWKQTIRFSAIRIFLLYITATALVTHLDYAKKNDFYQRFVNWIKGSVITDFSTEHYLPVFTVNFNIFLFFFIFWASGGQLL